VGTDEGEISKDCKDLLEGLLHPDPAKRLGANGIAELQNHPFFEGVNWSNISQNEYFYVPGKAPEQPARADLLESILGRVRE
jgi:serine/threonine protein kinase